MSSLAQRTLNPRGSGSKPNSSSGPSLPNTNSNTNTNRTQNSSANRPTPQGWKEIFPPRERDWKPSIILLNYDFVPLGLTMFSGVKKGQAFQTKIDFDQYFLVAEYGYQKIQRGETYSYTNQGNYFSFGPEVNFLKNETNGDALTFGLRYGHANFSDALNFMDSTIFGNYPVKDGNPNLKANWMEVTLSLSTIVFKHVHIGYTVRYKVLRQVKGIGDMAPYDVPGFGLYENNTGVQFNFYIGWVIRLREKLPPDDKLKAKSSY